MKHFILSAALLVATSASVSAKSNAPEVMANGYPYTQVPFTSVKMAQNSFWGARLKAAREVTVPLAFSKCESEHCLHAQASGPCRTADTGMGRG